MCMIDDCDEPVKFSKEIQRKAHKPHKCSECSRTINTGESYTYSTFFFDGEFHSNKRCSHCEVAAQWLQYHCGGWAYGAIEEDLEDHYDSGYREEDGLQKLLIGIRRQWREFGADDLIPIPRFVVRKVA